MTKTTDLRRAIKKRFVPLLEGKGFQTDPRYMPQFLIFRRFTPERIHVCDIQWEKYGRPRFVVNFGSSAPLGVVCHGADIEPNDVWAATTAWRGRLKPGRSPSTGSWFRQDPRLLERFWRGSGLKPPEDVVSELIELFSEIEDYWEAGTVGAHIRVHDIRWSHDRIA